jgi:hypothetical protein
MTVTFPDGSKVSKRWTRCKLGCKGRKTDWCDELKKKKYENMFLAYDDVGEALNEIYDETPELIRALEL